MERGRLVIRTLSRTAPTTEEGSIDRLRAAIGFVPVGLERWVRAAVGPVPFDLAPWAALAAVILAVAPLLVAGSAKQVTPATSEEMVSRTIPTTVTYVHLPGLAMVGALRAPGHFSAPPYGLLIRDSAASDAFTIVISDRPPAAFASRTVIGRIVAHDWSAAADSFAARGEDTEDLDPAFALVEVDEPPADEQPKSVSTGAELAELADGTLVSMPLAFRGESVATCTVSPDGCPPRRLAEGDGVFLQLADTISDSGPILVQTAYPSSVVVGAWTGTQLRNQPELEAFAASVPVQALAGWGRILVLASILDDPTILRDRLWLGPVLLALVAVLLWLGGRIGYPVFRPSVEGSRRWTTAPGQGGAAPTDEPSSGTFGVRVSGHATTVEGHRRHFDEVPAALALGAAASTDGRATAVLRFGDGETVALAAHDMGAIGSTEKGELVSVRAVQPALVARWYGTDLRLTFDSAADRDAAAAMLVGARAP